ncbi:hypothetical protein [Sandaracinus amylolyticus]|uniref:Uncharacterized protein n=1 Tax=Sandaracinus amylolyticus TaxID=927083 RepID=A0A0F6YFM4_9BACT|nr:hypothetical protein [Sandaracinus amylolyticus]AKF03866.1 hypothetical protein DB32_001015 [Sandaracinus amylolyticus]
MTQPQEQQREKETPAKADERKPERHPHMRDKKAPATTPHEGTTRDVEELNPDDFE